MTKFYAFWRALINLPVRLLWPLKVIGPKKLEKRKTILAFNHYGLMDPFLAAVHLSPQLFFWAKKELFKNRFIGWFLKKLGAIPVNREGADIASVKAALTALKEDKIFALFPEGTRNKTTDADAEMLQIKNGMAMLAIKSQAPIRVALYYRKSHFFRRNYLFVGDEFSMSDFYGQKLSTEVLSEASKMIEAQFAKVRSSMEDFLIKKGVIKVENIATQK